MRVVLFILFLVGNATSEKKLEQILQNYIDKVQQKYEVDWTMTNVDFNVDYEENVVRIEFSEPGSDKKPVVVNENDLAEFDEYCRQNRTIERMITTEHYVINYKLKCVLFYDFLWTVAEYVLGPLAMIALYHAFLWRGRNRRRRAVDRRAFYERLEEEEELRELAERRSQEAEREEQATGGQVQDEEEGDQETERRNQETEGGDQETEGGDREAEKKNQ